MKSTPGTNARLLRARVRAGLPAISLMATASAEWRTSLEMSGIWRRTLRTQRCSGRKIKEGEIMSDKTKGVPAGFHTATPYLIIKDAAGAMEFYKKAFGALRWSESPTTRERLDMVRSRSVIHLS